MTDTVAKIGFDPTALDKAAIDQLVTVLREIKAGKRVETGFGTPQSWALHFGFLKEETAQKPCRECGHPKVDYHYSKITPAGRALLAFADHSA